MRNILLGLTLAAAPVAAQDWKTVIVPAVPQAAAEAAAAVDRAIAFAPDQAVSVRNATPVDGMFTLLPGYADEKLTSMPSYLPKDLEKVLAEKEAFWARCGKALMASGPTESYSLENASRATARHEKRLKAVLVILDDIAADKKLVAVYKSGAGFDIRPRLAAKAKAFDALSRS